MAEFHTAGAPPNRGKAIRATIGWTKNNRNDPDNMAAANSKGVAPCVVFAAVILPSYMLCP